MAGKRANLTVLLGLNSKPFNNGLKRAKQSASNFAAGVGKMGLGAAKRAMQGLAIATTASAAAMVVGVKNALDFGGRMSDVSEQTGLSVEKIQIWEEALRQGGQSGEQFGNIINKMQKSIADFGRGLSTQRDAFETLGISFSEIANQSPDEQLGLIEDRLKGIANQAQRVGAARDIFGRAGAKLFATFADDNALEKARQSLGAQIEIFQRQAATFDRISDIMGGIGLKARGFFAGVADKLAPAMLAIAERFDKIDLAAKGQAFGQAVIGIVQNIAQFPEVMKSGMLLAAAEFINAIRVGFAGILAGVITLFGQAVAKIMQPFGFNVDTEGKLARDTKVFDDLLGGQNIGDTLTEMRGEVAGAIKAMLTPSGGLPAMAAAMQGSGGRFVTPEDELGDKLKRDGIPALLGARVTSNTAPGEFAGLDALEAMQKRDPAVEEQKKTNATLMELKSNFDVMAHHLQQEL